MTSVCRSALTRGFRLALLVAPLSFGFANASWAGELYAGVKYGDWPTKERHHE